MRIDYDSYTAQVEPDTISLFLNGRRYLVLQPGVAVNTVGGEDHDNPLPEPAVSRYEDAVEIVWTTSSNLWGQKIYHWRFEPDAVVCRTRIKGRGKIEDVRFFTMRERWSFFDFSRFFSPECSLLDQRYWKSMQYGCIDASQGRMSEFPMDENAYNHWIFTPPPLCYSLGFSSGPWLGAGIAPEPGEYNFTRFEYRPRVWEFCFRLTYDGKTDVDGSWSAPAFVFRPAADEYEALKKHCETLRAWKLVESNKHSQAEWWSRPVFCGWGEQNVIGWRRGARAQDIATQAHYDGFLTLIAEKRLAPGTIIIDDKWQKHYGTCEADTEKWPDLRGWIDARHAEGRKVLLWYGAWCPEGLDPDECLINDQGAPIACDPTSPKYQARIGEMLHRMLSDGPGCYNADGIKYDWTGVPIDPALNPQGDQWGIGMFKTYTKLFYDAAKAAKPDALIITHTANPYFAECTDMVRLNDIHAGVRELCDMMIHRQKIAKIACPHALIDCDNSSATTHQEWLDYMKLQPSLGVPSLYYLTALHPTAEPITDEDWDALAHIWR
ncbi:MAG: hypothetical protein ACP5R5_01015 [Armatimonadota bacterium]